jgi:IS5 family transposase
MLFLETYADLSDREVAQAVGYNLLYRAFVGIPLDQPVPDDTTLVRFRERIGAEGLEQVWAAVRERLAAAGLLGRARRVWDATHTLAKLAVPTAAGLLRQGRAHVLRHVRQVAPSAAARLERQYLAAAPARPRDPAEAQTRLAEEERLTRALLAELASRPEPEVRAACEAVQQVLAGNAEKVVSFVDPEARWGAKSATKVFVGYKVHLSLDPDSRLISAVATVPGNTNEAVERRGVVARERPVLEEGAVIIGDGLYGTAGTAETVTQAARPPCFASQHHERVVDAFEDDAATDQVRGVAGHATIGAIRQEHGTLYYFSTQACGPCPRQRQCLALSEVRRRVFIGDVYRPKLLAGEAGRQWRKAQHRHRYKIEQKHAELKRWHGLGRARYWGRLKVHGQALLAALVANAKRVVKLLRARGQPASLAPEPA